MTLNPDLAKRIRLVAFDVDGVMTDAGIYLGVAGPERCELKKFSTQDSVGIKILMAAGIEIALVSGRVSEATSVRAAELGIKEVIQVRDAIKVPPFRALLARKGVQLSEVAFVGDDIPDIPVMKLVALPVAVKNAVPEVNELAAYSTSRKGGDGAVREFVEALLKARGDWENVVARYLEKAANSAAETSNGV